MQEAMLCSELRMSYEAFADLLTCNEEILCIQYHKVFQYQDEENEKEDYRVKCEY